MRTNRRSNRKDTFIGFDSAWTDRAHGAICAVSFAGARLVEFHQPELVSFDRALTFIERVRSRDGHTTVALDQPTIVPNLGGMRPVERVAASVVSWAGGGVQPANRGRLGMFCDASPIWRFLGQLQAMEEPEAGRETVEGLHVMEVFPALALLSLDSQFFTRLGAPKYNPGRRKTFRFADWGQVARIAANEASALGCAELASWCLEAARIVVPRKPDQDMLDAVLCTLVAVRWRMRERTQSIRIGDAISGYIVVPVSAAVRDRLSVAARKHAVPIDGILL